MELNGWTSPQMLTRYGASARGARAAAPTTASWTTAPDPAMAITQGHLPHTAESPPAALPIRLGSC